MGLPDFLFDSHKRYKADTNRVAAWLAETAQKCGYVLKSQSSSGSAPTGGGRGKSKAGERTVPTNEAMKPGYTIRTQELITMAEVIAARKPPIKTPSVVIQLLHSAITLRTRCTQWFSSQASDHAVKNAAHYHFITVLEKILQILQPASSTSFSNDTDTEVDTLTNIFDVLDIEESEMTEIASPVAEKNIDVKNHIPPRRYAVESDDGEVYFAIYCFFDDLNIMRHFLQSIWEDYKNGNENLITASVTTNMAFQLVQQAEQELIATLPRLKSYNEISGLFYMLLCNLRGQDSEYREEHDDVVNPAMMDVAEWLYLPVASALMSFFNVIQKNHAPVLKAGHFGVYDPTSDRNELTARERVREDRIILMEAFPEFFVASKLGSDHLPVLL
jgi:hypothetical protein